MSQTQTFATGNGDERRALVVIFLRGGADGLNLVAPLEDDGYYRARPRIALSKSQALPLELRRSLFLVMGRAAHDYLAAQRAKAAPRQRRAIDRIWKRILDEGW